jgi:arylsulfatase A-like enzyme
MDRYDEEIASLDAELGRLFEGLAARGVIDRAWIVITSDHGEAFGEHGTVNHGSSVYNEQIRIPLIVVPPAGIEIPARPGAVSLLDVPATLAAVAGEPPLGAGIDLREPPRAEDPPARAEFFGNPAQAEPGLLRRWGALWNTPARAAVWRDRKLVELSGRRELYDVTADPAESDDLSGRRAAEVERLAALLPPLSASPAPPGSSLAPEQREALRALGYLDE